MKTPIHFRIKSINQRPPEHSKIVRTSCVVTSIITTLKGHPKLQRYEQHLALRMSKLVRTSILRTHNEQIAGLVHGNTKQYVEPSRNIACNSPSNNNHKLVMTLNSVANIFFPFMQLEFKLVTFIWNETYLTHMHRQTP